MPESEPDPNSVPVDVPLLVEDRDAGDVGGKQVRGALHTADGAADRSSNRLREERLSDSWRILDQHMAAGQEGRHDDPDQPPHLHFEIRHGTDGRPMAVDPARWLKDRS